MKKEYVIILVIAALALIWYFFIRNKNQTPAAAAIPGTAVAEPSPVLAVVNAPPAQLATATAPSQTMTTPAVVAQPSTGVQPVYMTVIDPSQFDAIILPWMNSLGVANKQQALKMYPTMTDMEKSALADIILNVWGGKRPQTSDDTLFWNTWRTKYHILDGTYSPFNGDDAQIPYAGKNNFDDPQKAYNGFTQKGAASTAYNGFKGRKKR